MTQELLNLQITDHAKMAYTALRTEDRRLVDAWFHHLRNWRNDEFVRSRSRRLKTDEDTYVFQTSADIVIAFRIAESEVTVVSIFRKDALRTFEAMAERVGP